MSTNGKALTFALAAALAGMALAGPAEAQTDGRWTPYLGCWQPAGGSSDGGLLCFRPVADEVGVEMFTVAENEIVMTEIFQADGTAQAIEREGCSGSETAEFSEDNRRIYTRSLYTCEGDVSRSATGIMSFVSPRQWVDVRSVGVEGDQMAWVQFYESASPMAVEDAGLADITGNRGMALRSTRMAASVPLDFEDVLDAAAHVDESAVQAWIAERGDRFNLSGSDLVALDDAGLDEGIIDVMVAVSNPRYFSLDAEAGPEAVAAGQPTGIPMRSAWNRYPYGRLYDPFFFDPFYYGYGSRYSYGYSPWGLGTGYRGGYGAGYGGWYGGYTPTPVVVTPVDQSSPGRVVNGRGYSRGRSSSGSGGGSPAYRGSGTSSGRSGSSAGSSSSGSSSRGSSTGRTARRRGGGG